MSTEPLFIILDSEGVEFGIGNAVEIAVQHAAGTLPDGWRD
jgi:hypothetical protein